MNLGSGNPIAVQLTYNPSNLTLQESLTDLITGAHYSMIHSGIKLTSALGASYGYVGFTGGTGAANATQTISNFTLNPVTPGPVNGFGMIGQGWNAVSNLGTALPPIQNNTVTLTQAGVGSCANAVWYANPVSVAQSFVLNFTYTGQANGADGVAFVLQNDVDKTNALGSTGDALGYEGITNSFAYQLDIWNQSSSGLGSGGQVGSYTTTGSVNLASGDPIAVQLFYNELAQTIVETLTDTVTGATYTATHTGINLANYLGSTAGYLGFTGGTGARTSTQTISGFSFQPIEPVTTVNGFGGNGAGWAALSNQSLVTPPINANTVTLTQQGMNSSAYALWHDIPIQVSQPFTVNFTYTGQANGANGVAFVLQNDPRGLKALGNTGAGLGYGGISNSFAYQLDIYQQSGSGLGSGGQIGSYTATGYVNLASGNPINVQLTYNPSTQTLVELLSDAKTGFSYQAVHTGINLSSDLQASYAYLGFTGATGGTTSTQTISGFSVQPTVPVNTIEGLGNGIGWNVVSSQANLSIQNEVLTLPSDLSPNTSAAWYDGLVYTNVPFTVSFTLTLPAYDLSCGPSHWEGIAFVLQNDPRGINVLGQSPFTFNGQYGNLGIQNALAYAVVPSGVNNFASFAGISDSENYLRTYTLATFTGDPINVVLNYDPLAQTLTETLTNTVSGDTFSKVLYGVNLEAATGGPMCYLGFTGDLHSANHPQSVTNFSFQSQARIAASSPQTLTPVIKGTGINIVSGGGVGTSGEPLVLAATGTVNTSASGEIYLSQTGGDLNLGQVTTGTNATITSTGAILSAAGNQKGSISNFGGSGNGWTQNGPSHVINEVLTLLNGSGEQAASAWFNSQLPLENGFTTSFIYQPGPGDAGLTLTIQNDKRSTAALGGSGSALGYASGGGQAAVSPSLGLAINVGSNAGVTYVQNGTINSLQSTGGVNLQGTAPIQVVLTYSPIGASFSIQLVDITTGVTYSTSFSNVNLATLLGSSTGYVGFTAAGSTSLNISHFFYTYGAPTISAGILSMAAGTQIGTTSRPVLIQAPGTVNANAPDGVYLVQPTGNVSLGTIATQGTATLEASTGKIAMAPGSQPIKAGELHLTSYSGLGTLSEPLRTEVQALQAHAGHGNLYLANQGPLTITPIAANNNDSNISIQADGVLNLTTTESLLINAPVYAGGLLDLHVTHGDLQVARGAFVASATAPVRLTADGQIRLATGSQILSQATGSLSLKSHNSKAPAAVIQQLLRDSGQTLRQSGDLPHADQFA